MLIHVRDVPVPFQLAACGLAKQQGMAQILGIMYAHEEDPEEAPGSWHWIS